MTTTVCGLWPAKRQLVAVLLRSDSDKRRLIRSANTSDGRFGLLEFLVATEAEIVTTEALARVDLLPQQAVRQQLVVWAAEDAFVSALLRAAVIRDSARAAALLARLPAIPRLRASLRRLAPPEVPPNQLPLIYAASDTRASLEASPGFNLPSGRTVACRLAHRAGTT